MKAFIAKGQLIYGDTEEGQIQLMDRADSQVTDLDIDANARLPASYGWKSLVGDAVEAAVIDGKTENICLLAEKE